jgi:8-oxo-dGTP pyrophosphatase MutT (NUDIX family)
MIPAESRQPILQASVIPFQRRHGRIAFCLITTRKGNWIFPKGIIDPGETLEQAATKEALEEAGVGGNLCFPPVGQYEYYKWGTTLTVTVLLMEVSQVADAWEEDWRQRRWVSADEAKTLIVRPELRELLHTAIRRIEAE